MVETLVGKCLYDTGKTLGKVSSQYKYLNALHYEIHLTLIQYKIQIVTCNDISFYLNVFALLQYCRYSYLIDAASYHSSSQ